MENEENEVFFGERDYKVVEDNKNFLKISNDLCQNFFELLNNFVYRTEHENEYCLNDLVEEFNNFQKFITKLHEGNEERLTQRRNKLNRQIATLKKANLKQ